MCPWFISPIGAFPLRVDWERSCGGKSEEPGLKTPSEKPGRVLVTGGAGNLGSELVIDLMAGGHDVTVVDNLRTGNLANLNEISGGSSLRFIRADLSEPQTYASLVRDCETVFHLATLRKWPKRNDYDSTVGLLTALQKSRVKLFVLHSTALVYGNASVVPTPETYGPLEPKVAYQANKLRCEGLVSRFAAARGIRAVTLRFANVVGEKSYHGVVRDYFERLVVDPGRFRILGDGLQVRSYVHVSDCVEAIKAAVKGVGERSDLFNVASKDAIETNDVAEIVAEEMGLELPKVSHTPVEDEGGGWPGDPRTVIPDTSKLGLLGWRATRDSRQAVREAVRGMQERAGEDGAAHPSPLRNGTSIRILEKEHWDRERGKLDGT